MRKCKSYAKIKIYYEKPSFGYGVCELMKRIKQLGSLSAACEDMGMAYSKGWKILKEAQKDMGIKLVSGSSGGVHGGGSYITDEGEELLIKYDQFYEEAKICLDKLVDKYFN